MPAMASSTSWPMVACLACAFQVRPARLGRHPEDALGAVLVGVLGVSALGLLGQQRGVLLLEGVGDVLQEQQAEADVLVLGGVHAAAQGIGHLPELGFVADVGGGRALRLGHFLARGHRLPQLSH
jgi:hypothetical protein